MFVSIQGQRLPPLSRVTFGNLSITTRGIEQVRCVVLCHTCYGKCNIKPIFTHLSFQTSEPLWRTTKPSTRANASLFLQPFTKGLTNFRRGGSYSSNVSCLKDDDHQLDHHTTQVESYEPLTEMMTKYDKPAIDQTQQSQKNCSGFSLSWIT